MREIKFRAWSKESKVMMMDVQNMYDSLGKWFDNHGKEIDCYEGFPVSSFGAILEDENCIVMQFTGLKDKNGKEIYEGDILKDEDGAPFEVRWQDKVCGFYVYSTGTMGDLSDGDRWEIIGNIHETLQMLEVSLV